MLKSWVEALVKRVGYRVLVFRDNYHEDGLFTYNSDAFRRKPRFAKAYARGVGDPGGEEPGT